VQIGPNDTLGMTCALAYPTWFHRVRRNRPTAVTLGVFVYSDKWQPALGPISRFRPGHPLSITIAVDSPDYPHIASVTQTYRLVIGHDLARKLRVASLLQRR
jgi:hypothetical protein